MHSVCRQIAPLVGLFVCLHCADASADGLRMLAQRSPLAGAQFHRLAEVWPELRAGDALTLEREPHNRHDPRAVRVLWRGRMLGYLPRAAKSSSTKRSTASSKASRG